MDTQTKKKALAAAKITYGAARCVSAVALACGHGLLSIAVKKPLTRLRIANIMLEGGQKTFKEGWSDWEQAK